MTEMRKAWYSMMMKKYDTDEVGVRSIMAARQKQSMESPKRKGKKHKGGFNMPGVAKQAGETGRKNRYSNEKT